MTVSPESFGARLRLRREERQIDLLAIAEQTKIKLALLEALERDDVSQWPAGIFRRAYIRTYAHAIGLEPDVVLREFLEVHPEPDDFTATAAAAAAAEEASRRNAAPPTRLRTMVDSAIGSLARLRRPATGDDPPSVTAPAIEHAAANPRSGADVAIPDRAVDPPVESPGGPRPAETADPVPVDVTGGASTPLDEVASLESRLEDAAQLCTALGQSASRADIHQLLPDAARCLDATGLIVWLWDETAVELRPALVHGYSERVLAHLPPVKREDDNATAASFRSGATCTVAATKHTSAALAVPLLHPDGCGGVLAIELQPGISPAGTARAMASLLAAALAQLVYRSQAGPPYAGSDTRPAVESPGPPRPPVKVRR